MEVVPLKNIEAEMVARAFYEGWITRFGVPYEVNSDHGVQFTSEPFGTLAKTYGIKLKHTTSYHLQCNGKIERQHRTLKTAIRAHNSAKWSESILTILLGIRASLKENSKYFIVQMVYGKIIKIPGKILKSLNCKLLQEHFLIIYRNTCLL
jgi:cleavage and polyadenylation specificity factor subunit 1